MHGHKPLTQNAQHQIEKTQAYALEYSVNLQPSKIWDAFLRLFKDAVIHQEDFKELTWMIYSDLSRQCVNAWEVSFSITSPCTPATNCIISLAHSCVFAYPPFYPFRLLLPCSFLIRSFAWACVDVQGQRIRHLTQPNTRMRLETGKADFEKQNMVGIFPAKGAVRRAKRARSLHTLCPHVMERRRPGEGG